MLPNAMPGLSRSWQEFINAMALQGGTRCVDLGFRTCQCSPAPLNQGMQAQITKAVLSQALLFMSKEKFEQWALILMLSLARLQ